jgi:hypothetical protein
MVDRKKIENWEKLSEKRRKFSLTIQSLLLLLQRQVPNIRCIHQKVQKKRQKQEKGVFKNQERRKEIESSLSQIHRPLFRSLHR